MDEAAFDRLADLLAERVLAKVAEKLDVTPASIPPAEARPDEEEGGQAATAQAPPPLPQPADQKVSSGWSLTPEQIKRDMDKHFYGQFAIAGKDPNQFRPPAGFVVAGD